MGPEGEPYAVVHSISLLPYSLKQAVGHREGTEQSGANRSLLVQDIMPEFITSNSLPIIRISTLRLGKARGIPGKLAPIPFSKKRKIPPA